MGVSKNSGFSPQIIHFNRGFHYKPSILGYHYFWKPPDSKILTNFNFKSSTPRPQRFAGAGGEGWKWCKLSSLTPWFLESRDDLFLNAPKDFQVFFGIVFFEFMECTLR